MTLHQLATYIRCFLLLLPVFIAANYATEKLKGTISRIGVWLLAFVLCVVIGELI